MEPLVKYPVFLMNVPRSGSTLLCCMLDSHPLMHAPDELHLTQLEVNITAPFAELTMELLGLESRELEHMLWDRILHRELARSGKQIIVEKDPRDLLQWRRFRKAWPEARFIFLVRHPGTIYASIEDSRSRAKDLASNLEKAPATGEHADLYTATVNLSASNPTPTLDIVLDRIERLEEARRNLTGLTIRYEDLVSDAEQITRDICDYLNVPWDGRMIDYGALEHDSMILNELNFSDKLTAGRIMPLRGVLTAEEMPEQLIPACRTWGYI
jgi:hypothetical protein